MANYLPALRDKMPSMRSVQAATGRVVRTAEISFGALTTAYLSAKKPETWGFPTELLMSFGLYGLGMTGFAGPMSDDLMNIGDGALAVWMVERGRVGAGKTQFSGDPYSLGQDDDEEAEALLAEAGII